MNPHRLVSLPLSLLFAFLGAAASSGQQPGDAIPNWPAPATWSPHPTPFRTHGLTTLSAASPLPFIGITPCRVADTRGNGYTGQYGPPALVANATRGFTITGVCGIPGTAQAVSFNFAALNVGAAGDLRVFPAGGGVPSVSTLNYNANTPNIANAAVVELGGGSITVQADAVSIDLIIDVNGYYAPAAGTGTSNTFLGMNAGNSGDNNTGFGDHVLTNNGASNNTAIGSQALNANTIGGDNTAIGASALLTNHSGNSNTATGTNALLANYSGSNNTAVGWHALTTNYGGGTNTAVGGAALQSNDSDGNTAIGYAALVSSTGSNNIAIGVGAGGNQGAGSHNIYIGNGNIGTVGESNTIRIGNVNFQDGGTIITGISGLPSINGTPVYVNAGGRMGTSTSSSWRVKQDIRDIGGESDRLMKLCPVAFEYKREFDPAGLTQYGLIVEEVAEVFPDLVTSDREGRPEGVRYHLLAPLLLNEVQKQRRTIETQRTEIEDLKARLARLEARLPAERQP